MNTDLLQFTTFCELILPESHTVRRSEANCRPGAHHKNVTLSTPQICPQEFKMSNDHVSCLEVYIVRSQ